MSFLGGLLNIIPKAISSFGKTIEDIQEGAKKDISEGKGILSALGGGFKRAFLGTPESRKEALQVVSDILPAIPKGSVGSQIQKGVQTAKAFLPLAEKILEDKEEKVAKRKPKLIEKATKKQSKIAKKKPTLFNLDDQTRSLFESFLKEKMGLQEPKEAKQKQLKKKAKKITKRPKKAKAKAKAKQIKRVKKKKVKKMPSRKKRVFKAV